MTFVDRVRRASAPFAVAGGPLDYQIPACMAGYLNAANVADPPLASVLSQLGQTGTGKFGLIKAGNHQDDLDIDPPGIVTIHTNDNQDSAWKHTAILEQKHAAGASRIGSSHQLLGGYREIGGGGFWWYRYTAALSLALEIAGDGQGAAHLKAATATQWLLRYIGAATPKNLGLISNDHETPSEIAVVDYTLPEGGGPPTSYRWRARIHFQVLVYVS